MTKQSLITKHNLPAAWFGGQWGTSEVTDYFKQQREVQLYHSEISEQWERTAGRLILDTLKLSKDSQHIRSLQQEADDISRPLALQVFTPRRRGDGNYGGPNNMMYKAVKVNTTTGEIGHLWAVAISATLNEQELTPVHDDDDMQCPPQDRALLFEMLKWQQAHGLLIPKDVRPGDLPPFETT